MLDYRFKKMKLLLNMSKENNDLNNIVLISGNSNKLLFLKYPKLLILNYVNVILLNSVILKLKLIFAKIFVIKIFLYYSNR